MASASAVDRELISQTIADLDAAIARLTQEREAISGRLEGMIERKRQWTARLEKLTREIDGTKRVKRRKGEVEDRIRVLMREAPEFQRHRGLLLSEISEKTGIPASSIRNVLERRGEFERVQDRWRLKATGASSEAPAVPGEERKAV